MPGGNVFKRDRLFNVHEDLVHLVEQIGMFVPVMVVCGYRDQVSQNAAYDRGFSKVKFPDSKHNKTPAVAVDLCPIPSGIEKDYSKYKDDYRLMYWFGGLVIGISLMLGIKIRWGGDWDGDSEVSDNKFNDLFHFELVEY